MQQPLLQFKALTQNHLLFTTNILQESETETTSK